MIGGEVEGVAQRATERGAGRGRGVAVARDTVQVWPLDVTFRGSRSCVLVGQHARLLRRWRIVCHEIGEGRSILGAVDAVEGLIAPRQGAVGVTTRFVQNRTLSGQGLERRMNLA